MRGVARFLAKRFLARLSVVFLVFVCCGCGSFSGYKMSQKTQNFGRFGREVGECSDLVAFPPKIFSLREKNQQKILYLSSEASSQNPTHIIYHFALFDTLGAPLLSKKLENGNFSNTKFLPPTKRYDKLFLKLLESIKQTKMLESSNTQKVDSIAFRYQNIEVKELENTNE